MILPVVVFSTRAGSVAEVVERVNFKARFRSQDLKESVFALTCGTTIRTVDTEPKSSVVILRRCTCQVAGICVSVNGIASVSCVDDNCIFFIEKTRRATIGASLTLSSIRIIELVRFTFYVTYVVVCINDLVSYCTSDDYSAINFIARTATSRTELAR